MSPDVFSVQLAIVPLLLSECLEMLKNGNVDELLDYLDDMAVTNEMLKEHLLCLDITNKFSKLFDKIETKTKTNFTKSYNKRKLAVKKTGGTRGKKETPSGE